MAKRKLTDQQILEIMQITPEDNKNYIPWYKSILISKTNCKNAAIKICELCKDARIPYITADEKCRYNQGKRKKIRPTLQPLLIDANAVDQEIKRTNRHEERMCRCLYAQQYAGDFEVMDFQIPTTDSGHDKIDLLLSDKDGVFYITETKKFSPIENLPSPETILRCVLEIQTYYQKLNKTFLTNYKIDGNAKLKKAILLDEVAYAWQQANTEWAKGVMKLFDITLLKLSREGKDFVISKVE